MKYTEFKKLLEDKGFEVHFTNSDVFVEHNYKTVAVVSKEDIGLIDLNWTQYANLPVETRKFIADKCVELAFTELEDREEEEKYYFALKGFETSEYEYDAYLKYDTESSVPFISNDVREYCTYKTQFTDKEFAALPDEIKSHNWEKIKVECEGE